MDYKKQNKQIKVPTVEPWLQKYYEKHMNEKTDLVHVPWIYPAVLEQRADLPPSIKKFKGEQFKDDNFSEWGK